MFTKLHQRLFFACFWNVFQCLKPTEPTAMFDPAQMFLAKQCFKSPNHISLRPKRNNSNFQPTCLADQALPLTSPTCKYHNMFVGQSLRPVWGWLPSYCSLFQRLLRWIITGVGVLTMAISQTIAHRSQ